MFAALIVISLLSSESDREKIALLLGIDVDEFYPPEMPSLAGNKTTEHGNATTGEVECKTFIPWCLSYAAASLIASLMLASALYKKSLDCVIPWFICKIISVAVQVVGFINYVTKASILERVIVTAFLNFGYTVGSIIIVYKAVIRWSEVDLHEMVNRVRAVVNIIRNFRILNMPRLQDILNRRSNNQNVGDKTVDSQTDNTELATPSDDVHGASAEVEVVTSGADKAMTSGAKEAEDLVEGVPTELDKAEGCMVLAVKETVSEESEMKSSASKASYKVSDPEHVQLGKVRFTDSVEVPASD
ncbi:uncharacterized protein [Periplaneta americana]